MDYTGFVQKRIDRLKLNMHKLMWIDAWALTNQPVEVVETNLVTPLTTEEKWAKLRLESERPMRRLTEAQIAEWMPHRRI